MRRMGVTPVSPPNRELRRMRSTTAGKPDPGKPMRPGVFAEDHGLLIDRRLSVAPTMDCPHALTLHNGINALRAQ